MARRKFRRSGTTRRRASTKTRSRRRHRVGATALNFSASSPLVKWGSVALGWLKPDLIPISKMVGDKLDGKIVAGAEVGLGFLLAMKKGKKKGMLQTVLGGYFLGAGIKKALTEFGIMSGIGPYGNVPVIGRRIAGPYGRVPVLGSYSPNGMLGSYTPNNAMNGKVMCGIEPGTSGYTSSDKGSNYMN